MDKITVIGMNSEKEQVVQSLMNLGVVELHKTDEILISESFDTDKSDTEYSNAQKLQVEMKSAIEISSGFYKEKKAMFVTKRSVNEQKFIDAIANKEEIFELGKRLENLVLEISNHKSSIVRLQLLINQLTPWQNLHLQFDKLETKNTITLLGSFLENDEFESMKIELQDSMQEVVIDSFTESENNICTVIIVHKEKEQKAKKIVKSFNFYPLTISETKGTPKELVDRYKNELSHAVENIDSLTKSCIDISKNIELFEILFDYAHYVMQKTDASNLTRDTKSTFIMKGYAPSSLSSFIDKELKRKFCVAFLHEKATNEDDYPILLKNNFLVKPYEVITEMFSTPSTHDIDPNPLMAPFFVFFFSLMLSDAGYGLLLAAGCALLIWKFNVKGSLRKMCLFLFQGGLLAIPWGILFGGFFGDIITVISSGKFSFPALWFNPIDDPIKLMALSMAFGGVHIIAGMGAKAYILIATGKIKDAVFDVFSWYFILLGAVAFMAGIFLKNNVLETIGKVAVLAGVGTVVLFGARDTKNPIMRILQGIIKLYDITGYFSDILSYTRILALSLATGVIAMVVNLLGSIMGFNFFGILLFIVAGLAGHTLNLALGTLGCYVHTSRLQYVEFFGKFYEGGGRVWNPLLFRTKFIEIENGERISNEKALTSKIQ